MRQEIENGQDDYDIASDGSIIDGPGYCYVTWDADAPDTIVLDGNFAVADVRRILAHIDAVAARGEKA